MTTKFVELSDRSYISYPCVCTQDVFCEACRVVNLFQFQTILKKKDWREELK
jgi:hypothetical protein